MARIEMLATCGSHGFAIDAFPVGAKHVGAFCLTLIEAGGFAD